MNLTKSEISFVADKKIHCFDVVHNISDEKTVEHFVDLWIELTDDLSDVSFCKYLITEGFTAMTWSEFEKLDESNN